MRPIFHHFSIPMYPTQNPSRQRAPYAVASPVYNQNNGSFGSSSQGLQSVGSTSGLTSFQVKISENYTLPPPIDFSRFEFRPVSNSQFELDLSAERKLLERYGVNQDDKEGPMKQSSEEFYPVVDPWGETIKHFVRKGHSREAVCLALAIFPNSEDKQMTSFLAKHEQLVAMGFGSEMASKALLHHKEDMQAATESCLASCGR